VENPKFLAVVKAVHAYWRSDCLGAVHEGAFKEKGREIVITDQRSTTPSPQSTSSSPTLNIFDGKNEKFAVGMSVLVEGNKIAKSIPVPALRSRRRR